MYNILKSINLTKDNKSKLSLIKNKFGEHNQCEHFWEEIKEFKEAINEYYDPQENLDISKTNEILENIMLEIADCFVLAYQLDCLDDCYYILNGYILQKNPDKDALNLEMIIHYVVKNLPESKFCENYQLKKRLWDMELSFLEECINFKINRTIDRIESGFYNEELKRSR